MSQRPRNIGRRQSDKELSHLRTLEKSVRNFIAHYEDHPEERFAPRTRQLVAESRAVFVQVDEMREAARRPASPETPSSERPSA